MISKDLMTLDFSEVNVLLCFTAATTKKDEEFINEFCFAPSLTAVLHYAHKIRLSMKVANS